MYQHEDMVEEEVLGVACLKITAGKTLSFLLSFSFINSAANASSLSAFVLSATFFPLKRIDSTFLSVNIPSATATNLCVSPMFERFDTIGDLPLLNPFA